jgi:asparagine synthase (glutamine-hydrolysing)
VCGILGAFAAEGVERARCEAALDMLAHRGPDARGSALLSGGRAWLGHRRLKIIDLSDGANQPMTTPDGRYTIVFNGEIYNYASLRKEAPPSWRWRTGSDTEVLLALYSSLGRAMLPLLRGMFAFCIHDSAADRLFLARDRFGIKPLYLADAPGGGKLFGSEIPPLLSLLPSVSPDEGTIRTWLETGLYDFGPRTFFRGVESLPPGGWAELDAGTGDGSAGKWYDLLDRVGEAPPCGGEELVEETLRLSREAVAENLVADVAVGLNVSGGVDSSVLVRIALERLGHAHLFTQDYVGKYSEEPWVREVSEGGTLHVERLDLAAIDAVLDETFGFEGEPFGGVPVCGFLPMYRTAREAGVTVLLDGNGVDEVFLGYKRHHILHVVTAPTAAEADRRAAEYEAFWEEKAPAPPSDTSALSIDGTVPVLREAIAPGLLGRADPVPLPKVERFDDPVRNLATADLLHFKVPRGLRFNDRVSMAASRELRVPFLDHRLVEFGLSIPSSLLLNRGGTKAIFRKAAARLVPGKVAFAAKRSVQSPQREWLASGWRPRVEEVLSSDSFRGRGWVDPDRAASAYRRFCEGGAENSFFVWQWLGLELWARRFLD